MALSGSTLEAQFKFKKEMDCLLVISSLQVEHTGKVNHALSQRWQEATHSSSTSRALFLCKALDIRCHGNYRGDTDRTCPWGAYSLTLTLCTYLQWRQLAFPDGSTPSKMRSYSWLFYLNTKSLYNTPPKPMAKIKNHLLFIAGF